ncbi:MAG: hypothetical protein ACRDP9_04255 [Kribbellaceae bacterium]
MAKRGNAVVIVSDMQTFPDSRTPEWASYSTVAVDAVPAGCRCTASTWPF